MTTPIFQQGEHVIRRGEAARYYKGKQGWSNTIGVLYLTNQRLVHVAGFGNQRNWPLDHVVKVQTGVIDTIAAVAIEFDNGMVEWFAPEESRTWINAIQGALPRRPVPKPIKPTPPLEPTSAPQESKPASSRRLMVYALAALGVGIVLCLCAMITAAVLYFTPVSSFMG